MNLHLSKYGSSLKLANGQFKVKTKDGESQVLNPHQVKRIYLNRGVALSSDVMFMAISMGIPVILKQRTGKVAGRMWSAKYGSIASLRRKQLGLLENQECIILIKDILNQKLVNQQELLLIFDPEAKDEQEYLNASRSRIDRYRRKLLNAPQTDLKQIKKRLMGFEGSAGRTYFKAISHFLPKMYQFEERAQRPAGDIFNSSLNFAYGLLYSIIEGFVIESGLDPYTGLFHREEYNRPVLVYDIIERYRIWSDVVIINLCRQHILFEDFFEREEKALYLNDFAKKIVIHAFSEYMAERINLNGKTYSREGHIQAYIKGLATAIGKNNIQGICSI